MPVVTLPAKSIVRTDKALELDTNVTPLAVKVEPDVVAFTHVVPSALTWIVSPVPSVPVKLPLIVCAAVLVIKSLPDVPVSALNAVTVAVAVGATVSIVTAAARFCVVVLPATSVDVTATVVVKALSAG